MIITTTGTRTLATGMTVVEGAPTAAASLTATMAASVDTNGLIHQTALVPIVTMVGMDAMAAVMTAATAVLMIAVKSAAMDAWIVAVLTAEMTGVMAGVMDPTVADTKKDAQRSRKRPRSRSRSPTLRREPSPPVKRDRKEAKLDDHHGKKITSTTLIQQLITCHS